MMRYSEIPRDFSSDSLRFVEYGEEYIYQNLRDESPPSDISNNSGPLIRNSPNNQNDYEQLDQQQQLQLQQQQQQQQHQNQQQQNSHDYEYQKQQNNDANGGKQRKDSTKSSGGSSTESSYTRYRNCGENNSFNNKNKQSRRKNSIGSACINALSSSPNSGCYYNYGSTPSSKTQSLPANTSIKDYDSVILNALRVSPEELANQITLLDFPIFAAIQPDELTSCAWTKKDKYLLAPNIVAFTKRFNHTSFWTVQEILCSENHKERAEVLAHFIKVAKKLFELNNLHSLFAIISAMQSASIYRLKKTWSCISKKDKQTFDRLANVFSDHNNWENLREYLESLRLPCIPYLGLFLTDLIYIDLAHPHKGGLEPEQRRNKMNNILRVISNYQQSDYSHIQPFDRTLNYLQSIRYIEELQNIFEEDQYKRSLKLEPSSSSVPSSSSCSSKESFNVDVPSLACLNLSPAKTVGSVRISKSAGAKFIPTHRKCRSLGSKFRSTSLPRNFYQKCDCPIMMIVPGIGTMSNKRCKCRIFGKMNSHQNSLNTTGSVIQPIDNGSEGIIQSRHLLDDSVLEDTNSSVHSGNITQGHHHYYHHHHNLHHNSQQQQQHTNHQQHQYQQQQQLPQYHPSQMIDKNSSLENYDGNGDGALCNYDPYYADSSSSVISTPYGLASSTSFLDTSLNNLQGCVRRKTILKDGRKPAVASWQRYWLQIWANSLVYFPPKSFKGSERCDFKREPCKVCPLDGWSAQVLDNPKHKNSFELFNPTIGTVYKFRTDCERITSLWANAICNAAHRNIEKSIPVNLMSFE